MGGVKNGCALAKREVPGEYPQSRGEYSLSHNTSLYIAHLGVCFCTLTTFHCWLGCGII